MGGVAVQVEKSAGFSRSRLWGDGCTVAATAPPEVPIPTARAEVLQVLVAACPHCGNRHLHTMPANPDDPAIRRCARYRFKLYRLPPSPSRKKRRTMFTGNGTYPHRLSGREIGEAMGISDSRVEQLFHEPAGSPGRARIDAAIRELIGGRRTRSVLPPDHPLARARQHGITTKEIVAALGWSSGTGRLWTPHSAREMQRITAAVDGLIAAKEQEAK